ncbi:MAG: 4-(cytidine 5'-diphospho)-2-C-methyl-D-erythritol kinase [Bacteroidia bacterium]|nr:4-(cytidine 5'-diphospho)-2-C-methyl-D-erythritol kinase [Bacteroidia bacterium]MCX7764093.1 4-(cytidine 5'-diphospho)-2-C-methyl-D-erythritol kinase [Bacteroidia bacterium]MDW8058194.1 4-(cytidine 5'-diphospho)-2-C-methyl-D-erythritol kinase [Bacteroidia bacterium]
MKTFHAISPAKINLGLHILGRWPDGYHILETLLIPYPDLYDDLEVRLLPRYDRIELHITGIEIPDADENYLETTYWLLREKLGEPLPALSVRLHKRIPVSAGLGGGSSNSGTFLRLLQAIIEPPPPIELLHAVGAEVGSDVPFFLYEGPMLARGTGTQMIPFSIDLSEFEIVTITPPVPCSTKHIYRGLRPSQWSRTSIEPILRQGIETWQTQLHNDLESVSFQLYPTLITYKKALYEAGAVYASMNGSGSSLYGLFRRGS